jgi:hypothetical protein
MAQLRGQSIPTQLNLPPEARAILEELSGYRVNGMAKAVAMLLYAEQARRDERSRLIEQLRSEDLRGGLTA